MKKWPAPPAIALPASAGGADAPEIEVTPEMIEAGAKAIGFFCDDGVGSYLLGRAAEEAFVAMRAASRDASRLALPNKLRTSRCAH